MNLRTKILASLFCAISLICSVGCSNGKTYAQLLNDENMAVNSFLADQRVEGFVTHDKEFAFEIGENAPYYQMDKEGNIYMQVLNYGTPDNFAETDELIYFRFTRYNIENYASGTLPEGEGNDSDMTFGSSSFRFNNQSNTSSAQWGAGVQTPLFYLPIDCEVNILIKSQYGLQSEISSVTPYLYRARYFKSQI